MTTTKHPIVYADDRETFTYRGLRVTIKPKAPDKTYRYTFWLRSRTLHAATVAGMCKVLDQYLHEEKVAWTPVRKGAIYCSPRCGMKCTHAEFKAAEKRGFNLAKLLGPGWSPRVWENCGWHASAKNGVAELHTPNPKLEGDTYDLFFNTAKQVVCHGPDPVALVADAIEAATATAQAMTRDILAITPRPPTKAANDSAKPRRRKVA